MEYTGLFHRAIAQSGSTRCPWAIQYDVGEYTNQVAEILNCPTTSSQELVDCLRTKEAVDIINAKDRYLTSFVSLVIVFFCSLIIVYFMIYPGSLDVPNCIWTKTRF